MGDIDQALSRAYARRTPAEPMQTPAASPAPAGVPPAPHFAIEGPRVGEPAASAAVLDWPQTVRALEREHGERFERLADALVEARVGRQVRTLLFTSCHRSEGRTTLVLTLARALARRAGRTLLVDADVSGPMLARLLGLRPLVGLDDVIEAGAAAADAVVDAPDDHLSVLALRAPATRPRDFTTGAAWSTTLARLRRDFDHVLVDGGPLFAGLSAAPLPRSLDAAVLVHNRSLTGPKALLRAREILDAGGIPLLGLAETFV